MIFYRLFMDPIPFMVFDGFCLMTAIWWLPLGRNGVNYNVNRI